MKGVDEFQWKTVQSYHGRHSGIWKEGDLWIRYHGVWRQLVPPNAVILYDTNSGWDGEDCTLLNNRYLRSVTDTSLIGGNSGASTHVHGRTRHHVSSHTNIAAGTWGLSRYATNGLTHSHLGSYHSHPTSASNAPSAGSYRLRATMQNSLLRNGAVFFNTLSSLSATSLYSYLSALSQYIILATTTTTGIINGSTHNHGSVSVNTQNSTARDEANQAQDSWWSAVHRHTATHTDQTRSHIPYSMRLRGYKVNTTMFFDQLPSKTVVLFLSSKLPKGWSVYNANERLLCGGATAASPQGYISHPHSVSNRTTGGVYNVTSAHLSNGTHSTRKRVGAHTHTFTCSHSTATNMPLSINLYFGVKD